MDLYSLPLSYWLGCALALWVIYDLITGQAYLHRAIKAEQEPALYWFTMAFWLGVAISCFAFPDWLS